MSTYLDRLRARTSRALSPAILAGSLLMSCRAAEPHAAASTSMPEAKAATSTAVATQTPPAAAGAKPTCGSAGQPECPTQRWMKATLQAYLRTRDYKRLEVSFKTLASRAPQGFERWGEMAESGARGAASSDEAAVRKSCQECHDSYRAQFREQYRSIDLL